MVKVAKNSAGQKERSKTKGRAAAIKVADAERFVRNMMATDLHAARVASLSRAALGVTVAGSLAIHAIGRGLAAAENLTDKHTIKQVDHLLSNDKINP